MRRLWLVLLLPTVVSAQELAVADVAAAAARARDFLTGQVACRGGYLWWYSLDLTQREGEGRASPTTIWVQKPGTPAVGEAYLRLYAVTGDTDYLDAATAAGLALAWGQLATGGWDYRIEFEPEAARRWYFRREQEAGDDGGRRRRISVLDDDNTQLALRFLIGLDQALDGREPTIRRAVTVGLESLLAAQYPSGGWAQAYSGPADPTKPVQAARYPAEWSRTPPRDHDYWQFYTLNDNTLRDCINTCFAAWEAYGDERFRQAALRGGEFILRARMPEPQPVWAQQYNFEMEPIWARRFEPPSVTGGESVGVMRLLVELWLRTGDDKFIAPLPAALRWFRESQIAPNRWARFYELRTNRPLYFVKDTYELTYDDGNLPTHYSFQSDYAGGTIRWIEETLERGRDAVLAERAAPRSPAGWARRAADLEAEVRSLVGELDADGRWVTNNRLEMASYVDRLGTLADYLEARSKAAPAAAGEDKTMLVYLGTYSQRGSQGIYVARFNPADGTLALTGQTAELRNPSFLAFAPGGRHLYAVSEIGGFEGTPGGAVAAFAVAADGGLTLLGQQPTHGAAPCHLVVEPEGRYVLAANYSGGNAVMLPIGADGTVGPHSDLVQHAGSGPNAGRQEGPHAHSVTLSPDGRFAFVCDLGLDRVVAYQIDRANGKLQPAEPPYATTHPGAGPRHFAFHPNGRFGWAINELDSTVTGYAFDAATGAMTEIEHLSTLPADFDGKSFCADIHVHPNGRFLYGSNRGHDSLAIYAIDEATGRLSSIGFQPTGGRTPRNFALDPTGRWILAANQESDNVVVLAIDPETGRLTPNGQEIAVPAPVCVRFAP